MIVQQGIIASSLQNLLTKTVRSLNDYSVMTYTLCSFSAPEGQVPYEWFGFTQTSEFASTTYSLCSFSISEDELSQVFLLIDPSPITLFKTSIYGISSTANSQLSSNVFSTVIWEVSSSNNSNYVIDSSVVNQNSYYATLANIQPILIRASFLHQGVIYKTPPLYVKPYENPLDIPNLQLWLDASADENIVTYYNQTTDQVFVSAWFDQSPTAAHATTPALSSRQPTRTYVPFGNELGLLQFNGTSNFMDLITPINVSNNFTHFFIYYRPNNNVRTVSLGNRIAGDNTSPFLHWSDDYFYSGDRRSNATQVLNSEWQFSAVRKNQYLYVDGGYERLFTTPWGGTKRTTVNAVGAYSFSNFHQGAMGEIIQTSAMLPNNEIQMVCSKLNFKWFGEFTLPPRLIRNPIVSSASLSSLSSTYGSWGRQATSYQLQWQQSNDGNVFTDIPLASSMLYYPTTADYQTFFRTSASATNVNGTFSSLSNVIQLTTVNTVPVSTVRTTIFTVSAIPGTWLSLLPITLLYQWQVSAVDTSGWQNFGSLSTSNTVFLSAYSLSTVNVRVFERPYNSTLELVYG